MTPADKLTRAILTLAILVVLGGIGLAGRQLLGQHWDPLLEPYVEFVEAERGLEFIDTVPLEWVDVQAEFQAHTRTAADSVPDDADLFDPTLEMYILLGLVDAPDTISLTAEEIRLDTVGELAAGYYATGEATIFVDERLRDREIGPLLVHELVHALQHQHGMLRDFGGSPDAVVTRTALIEGDARRIENRWLDQMSDVELAAYRGDDEGGGWSDPSGSFFESSFGLSYWLGAPMVESLIQRDGQQSVDDLLRSTDPGTSERMIDVLGGSPTSVYNGRFGFGEYVESSHDGVDGDVGAINLFRAFAPLMSTEEALDAILGYDNDAFVVTADESGVCATLLVWFDSPEHTAEFIGVASAHGISARRANGSSEDGPARLDLCEPIGDPADQRFGTLAPVVMAANLTLHHLVSDRDPSMARCAALAQVREMPANRPLELVPDVADYVAESAAFVEDCASL